MWWSRGLAMGSWAQFARLLSVGTLALSVPGCSHPLYGDRSVVGGGSTISTSLAGVDVAPIPAANGTPESRIAVELRNDLLFAMNGGQVPSVPSHELRVRITSTRLSV